MYILRHLAYVAVTFARTAVKPRSWRRGVWYWLSIDALIWIWDAFWLMAGRQRRVECDCCGWRGQRFFRHTFVSGTTVHRFKEEACPRCESLCRQRQLVRYLGKMVTDFSWRDMRILDIGPGSADLKLFAKVGLDGVLLTMDIRPGAAMLAMDITRMAFKDGVFDIVVCSHVLEHVPGDGAALQDMRRLLKPGGICIVQVPIQAGLDHTIEYGRANSEEFDHVRVYGRDFVSRLTSAGFLISYSEDGLFEVRDPAGLRQSGHL